jgi:recombination protein RecT
MTNQNKVDTKGTKDKLMQKTQNTTPVEKPQGRTMAQLIEQMMPAIKESLPQHIKPERIARLAMTTIRNTPKLQQCNPVSFLGAVMQAAQLGVEPNTNLGEAYIIPYGTEATFQIGYKGILSLAFRTGEYQAIYAHEVYENDEFSYQLGLNKDIHHVPADEPKGDPTYYYAVYKLKNGGYDFAVWSRAKVQQHAQKYSAAVKGNRQSPWKSDFDSMAKKTVLLQALKYAPKSIEFAQALSNDDTVTTDFKQEPKKADDIIDFPFEDVPEQAENVEIIDQQ